jgi:uncharacterized integral membrane protein
VRRLLAVYASGFATATVLFALYGWLAPESADVDWNLGLWRLVLFVAGIGSALSTWAVAIWMATVHRTAWPLAIAVLTVCAVMASIVLRHGLAS